MSGTLINLIIQLIAGAIIVGFWVLCAIFGRAVVLQDPFASSPLNSLTAPNADNWFGTDRLGRDVFSRVIVGARRHTWATACDDSSAGRMPSSFPSR